ncbi:hypothetical protein QTP86_004711 [Hemibagrus guttatus]|nr:hypothetical protein QTP86_004711 [Hemibagrus guttatus]
MEKYRDGQRELHCVFVDLEKAYDRVPREELWYCMRKSGVAEKYVRVVQDMYERSRTVVRCAVGQTEEFKVEVGLHQGSALSPFLFAIVMDQLSEEVRQESPWTMMFADDIVICSESREQVEENLERWRFALERRGMKVSCSKTEYMCVNEREGCGTVRLQGEEVKKVQEFKYLGSTVQSNGECGKEVKKRVQADWNGWRKVSGVLCDRKISARIKGKVYRTVVRPAMLYGLETVSLRKRQESELEVAELKMLRFSLGVTRLDRIRNEYIRGTAHVGRLGDKVREARLRWFGHVQRRKSKAYEITYVRLKFYTSRPESFAIYKRTNETAPWQPYQYYSASCQKTYGRDSKGFIRPGEEERTALCTDEFSDISPLTGGNVAFSTLEGRPSAYNFDQSPVLQLPWGRCPTCCQRRRVPAAPCSHPPAPWGVPDPSETDIVATEPLFVGGRRSVRVLGGGRRSALQLGGGRRLALLLGCGRHSALRLGCGRHSAPPLGCGRRVGPFGLAVGSFAPPTCLAPASHSPHVPCLDPRSPHLPRLGPRFPPLALLLLLAPPQVPRPAPHSPHRPLYVPSSSPGPIAGPDFLGGARSKQAMWLDTADSTSESGSKSGS